MKPPISPEISTINEIRTERLSRALQKMRKKSISVCAMRGTIQVNIEKAPSPEKPPKKALFESQFSSTESDDAAICFRRRTSSVPVIKEAVTEPLPFEDKASDGALKLPTVSNATRGGTLNRLVKQLLHRRDKDTECGKAKSHPNTSRANTLLTIFDPGRSKEKSALSVRVRSQTSVQPAPIYGMRSISHHPNYQSSCSKSSSGVSSRCHSPMRFSTMLSLPTSEPVSPGGTISPLVPENSFTVLVIGSEGVGKGALVQLFLQSDARKASGNLEMGYEMEDVNSTVTLVVENEETHLRFIEVNNEKNDLWLSLSAAAHIVLYNYDDPYSFRNSVEVVNKLRECSDHTPVMLVSNNPVCDPRRAANANADDGRHLAKQANCRFFEISLTPRPNRVIEDLLVTLVHQVRRSFRYHHPIPGKRNHSIESTVIVAEAGSLDQHSGLGGGFFHLRTWSTGSNSSSTGSKTSPRLSVVRQKFWKRKAKSGMGANLGTSCTNLTLTGLQKYFNFANRRGSLSLENLAEKAA